MSIEYTGESSRQQGRFTHLLKSFSDVYTRSRGFAIRARKVYLDILKKQNPIFINIGKNFRAIVAQKSFSDVYLYGLLAVIVSINAEPHGSLL